MTTYKNIVAELRRAEENGSLNQQETKKGIISKALLIQQRLS